MTNGDLKNILQQPDVPDLDAAARERIVSSAAIRYRHAASAPEPEAEKASGGWLSWSSKPLLAAVAALVLVIAMQNIWLPGSSGNGPIGLATDGYSAAVFEEYRSLFQDDLQAVVAHNGDVEVVLGGQDSQHNNPLVLIRIEAGGKPVYITAYSGQTIETEIGGKTVMLDILTTADQDVLLASDEFMLESGVLHGPDNFSVDAHVLEVSL